MIDFIKHAYQRFKAPTPAFWKSVQRKLVRLAAMFVALGALYEATPAGYINEWVITWITYGGIVCGTGAIIAQFACEDQPTDGK